MRLTMRFPAYLLLGLLAACTTQELRPVPNEPQGFAPWTETTPVYRFGAGDRVRVQFLLTPEMNETSLIAPDGTISTRATGSLAAAGLTAKELEAAITRASRRVLNHPIVTAALEDAGGATVLVGGAVKQPGAVPLRRPSGSLEVIIQAGGFEQDARMNEVVLIRRGPDNRPMLRTLDVRGFIQTASAEPGQPGNDIPLFPGDIVYVPRSRIGEINQWVDQYINRLIPFQRTFSYAVNRSSAVPF
ncbi:polysaccharide biosynthesis/export family protein [Roseomonas populi]|uniref:Polysaccharide export protein n=1 Tax=Roseomonas populi TaxID=3121582 RepID=A0ABT1X2K3_9PROT|nr:polysaccharide biosynthesis/export family protein [Roseomonas pecuniae]MCR0982326.1 polysaccharide export protein [Roseomonas pecuniae]